jgi:hypothetical protein
MTLDPRADLFPLVNALEDARKATDALDEACADLLEGQPWVILGGSARLPVLGEGRQTVKQFRLRYVHHGRDDSYFVNLIGRGGEMLVLPHDRDLIERIEWECELCGKWECEGYCEDDEEEDDGMCARRSSPSRP